MTAEVVRRGPPLRLPARALTPVAFGALPVAFGALPCALAAAAAGALPAAAGVADLLVGEYDNHEQVWQRQQDGGASVARVHWLFTRLDDGRIGVARGHGQTAPRQPAWMLRFDGDRATVLLADGRELACVYRWKKLSSDTPAAPTEAAFDAGYVGIAQDDEGCPAELPTRWELTRERLVATRGETLRARRVTRYAGWAALQRRRIDPDAADDDYVLLRDLALHDEGCIIPITDAGKPTGYAIELARLTYQDTRTAVLKLGVISEATGETLSYSWAEPGAERIGINLRWIQAGMTRLSE